MDPDRLFIASVLIDLPTVPSACTTTVFRLNNVNRSFYMYSPSTLIDRHVCDINTDPWTEWALVVERGVIMLANV